MKHRKRRFWTGALVLGLCLKPFAVLAQSSSQDGSPKQSQEDAFSRLSPSMIDYVIRPGDILSIRVLQDAELSGDVQVSPQGDIRIPYMPEPIKAAGHTSWQLAELVRQKLDEMLWDPQVSIQVKEGQPDFAYVLGEVHQPGQIPVRVGSGLLNMVVAAGGLTKEAGNVAYILRTSLLPTESQKESSDDTSVNLSSVLETIDIRGLLRGQLELTSIERANRPIYPGDIVSIPEADKVFVGGNVETPGVFQLRGDLTLTQALLLAGGVKPATKKSQIRIVRPGVGNDKVTETVIDLGNIEKDLTQDVKLQPNDIVFVPTSKAKSIAMKLLDSFVLQFAVSAPLYLLIPR